MNINIRFTFAYSKCSLFLFSNCFNNIASSMGIAWTQPDELKDNTWYLTPPWFDYDFDIKLPKEVKNNPWCDLVIRCPDRRHAFKCVRHFEKYCIKYAKLRGKAHSHDPFTVTWLDNTMAASKCEVAFLVKAMKKYNFKVICPSLRRKYGNFHPRTENPFGEFRTDLLF